MTSEHIVVSARYAQCTHERMLPNVCKRTADLVDAAILRSTFNYYQQDLELIDGNHVNVSNDEFQIVSNVRHDTTASLYMMNIDYKGNATVFAKSYNGRIDVGNIEYRIMHRLHSRHLQCGGQAAGW